MRACVLTVLSVALAACVHAPELVPAPQAATDPQHPNWGVVNTDEVQLVVRPGAWKGVPPNLPWYVTPIEVSIENHSQHKIRVALKDFSLGTQSGFQATALPPFSIQTQGTAGIVRPEFAGSGFLIAPSYSALYPGYPPWSGGFDVDPSYYGAYSGWTPPLPSPDMLAKAMPEGVLNPGGNVRGFLYFQRIPDRPAQFALTAALVDAGSGKRFGVAVVPLLVNP